MSCAQLSWVLEKANPSIIFFLTGHRADVWDPAIHGVGLLSGLVGFTFSMCLLLSPVGRHVLTSLSHVGAGPMLRAEV